MMKRVIQLLLSIALLAVALLVLSLRDNPARPVLGEPGEAESNGMRIQYYVSGPVDAEPVVLLASYARSGSDFNELAGVINRAGYRTIVMQARGIGGTGLPGFDVTLFDYADDLAAVLNQEKQGNTPVTVVGHAFGNRIARAFSSRYPEKVRSLVLLAAGDSAPPPETRNDIFRILAGILPESTRTEALHRAFFAPGNRAPAYWVNGWYPRSGLAQGNATASTPQEQWVGGGEAPMLVVQPEHDAAAAHGGKKLKQLYPDRVTLLELEGAGHAILPEQPERVSRIVVNHLANR